MLANHAQRVLDLGPETHFDVIHGQHAHEIALATKPHGWSKLEHHFTHPHDIARRLVSEFASTQKNAYLSQSGFSGRRSNANVAALTSLFVDLDTYQVPELHGMPPEALLERVEADYPWLPPVTLLASSGRGAYFVWVLEQPLPKSRLPQWQTAETELVQLLAPFGADPAAKDAARILRVCGSLNTKSGQRVWYRQIHDPVPFAELAGALHQHCAEPARPKPAKPREPSERVANSTHPALWNGYTLAHARMQDLNLLARMRGPLTDYRHRFLYVYAVASAWYCPTIDALVTELDEFAEQYFTDAHKYRGRTSCGTVIDRMKQARQGTKHQWRGDEIDPRYKMQNPTIIRLLDISEAEQCALSTIISTEEKARRKAKRDKARYERSRPEYLAEQAKQTESQRQTVLALVDQGLPKTQVAKQLGLSERHIRRILAD